MDAWVPLQAKTLKENVTIILRKSIIDGTIAAGEVLNQAQIAERLGISRGPIREALGQLEQEGLIRNVPYKGVVVTPLSPTYVRELYDLRSAMEVFALRAGMARNDPHDVAALECTVEAMRESVKRGDPMELARLDLRFHSAIIQMARNSFLERSWTPMMIGVQRCLQSRHRIYATLDEIVGSHPEVLAAIVRRDVEQACSLLHRHIIDAGDQLCEHWLDVDVDQGIVLP